MEDKKPVSSDKWTEALYETLKLNNAYDKDYDTFYNDFYAPGIKGYTYRKDVYDDMTSHGLDLGATYEDFASKIGLHAIDPQTQQTPMGADSISKDMTPVEVTPTKKPEAKKEEKPEVSAEAVSENQHPIDTLQDFNPNVSRMRNAGTDYYLQAAEEISNNAYSKSLEELANQAAKDLKREAYQRPKEDSYVRLNQTARYIPIRSLPKDADLDSVFEAALTFENQVCGGAKEYTFASLGGDIQERYEKWKALRGHGSSYTQETASMSPNAVYLQAINLQALGKERPAWISELRWNEALNYDKNKLNKITAELEQEDQKRRLKRSDGAYPDDVSLNGMYHANYTALMASDIYNNGTNKTIFVLFQDGRIRPLQAPDPSILRGGVEAQRELFRRQYEKMTFGEEGKEGYTDPYEKNRVVGNFLQNGEVCHIIYFPYMIEQRRWDDAQELIKIGTGGKFNEKGVLLNPDDRLQIVPVVVKNGESEEDAIAKAKVELDNEISKKLPYKETYLQQQIAQAREALKKEQERLKQFGDHDYIKESYMAGAITPRSLAIKLMANTEEGAKISDEVALARGNIRKLEESIKKYTQALEALRTGDKVGAWGGFLEGISDLDNWTFGLYNLRENLVAVKAHEGKMGQEAKDRLGLARSLSQESMSAFHRHGEGRLYGPAFGAGYSFPFTIGAIATYGAGNVAARGIIRGGSRMAAKYGTNWLFDTTIRATTRLAAINAAGVIDSSFQMPRIISDAAIEKMGLMNYTFDENQRIVVTGTQQEKSWGHSLLHSGLNTLVQNVSERVGTYVLEPVAKAFGIGKISLRSFGEALPYNKTIHMIQNGAFAKAMSKVYGTFEKGGYDGFVNEVLEEYIANPMTATFDENYTFADIFDSRQNLDTALSVWASSIFMLGFSSTASSVKYYRTLRSVNSAYDKAEANARRLFGNENWDKIQNTILRLEGEPLVNAIYAGVCQNKSLSDEQKKAFLNYVRAQKAQAVFNNAVSEKYSFSLTGEELNEMNAMTIHAYAEGRNMQTPQEYAQAQQAFADTREMAMSALGVTDDIDAYLDTLGETPAEQLKKGVEVAKENGLDEKAANAALSAYLNAREQQKGAMDGITSDESIRRQHADSVIRQITFENEADSEGGSGKVILVNVKGREKPVFLIRGRYENGSITGETVVVSEGNGVIEMIPASEVEGIVEESDAMTERQRKYDKIDAENKEQQRLINLNMDTPLAGQGGILMDEEGHRRQVGIKCVFNDEQGNPASVLVVDQNNNDYLIPIDVFREQRGRGRKFEAIEPYLDETDEEYHAAEGPMNEEYNLANKEQEGVSEEDAQGAAEGVTPQPATDATEKPTKPEVKYDYHVKMKDGSGNAVSGRVTNLSADGVEIEFDAPYNGKMVDRIPLEDFDNGVSEIADANGNVLWNETEAVGDTEVAPQVDATPTQVGQEDAEKSAIAQAEQEHKPTALERIPKDENGNPIYEQTDAETAFTGLTEEAGNVIEAEEIAKSMVEDKEKALEKAKKIKLPSGVSVAEKVKAAKVRTQAIAKAQEELDKWKAIAEVPAQQRAKVVEERIAKEKAEAEAKRKAEEAKRANEDTSSAPSTPINEQKNTDSVANYPLGEHNHAGLPNGRKQVVNRLKMLNEASSPKDKLGLIYRIMLNVKNGEEGAITPEEQAYVDKLLAELKEQGYEMDNDGLIGGDYNEGDINIVDDIQLVKPGDPRYDKLEDGQTVINRIIKPRILKDGKLYQAATVGAITRSDTSVSSELYEAKKKLAGLLRADNNNEIVQRQIAEIKAEIAELEKKKAEELASKVSDKQLAANIEAASAEVDTNAGEENEEIKPIGKGVFGNIYDQFKGKVKAAFDFLIKHKSGDLLGVFHREGFGDIDLVWGDDKKGLQHIINDHILVKDPDFQNIEEAVSRINDIIMSGVIVKEGEAKIVFEKDGYRVVISKNIHGEKKNWILTSYDSTNGKGKIKERLSDNTTTITPGANKGSRAVASSENLSTDKVTESSPSPQENGPKNSTQSAIESASAEVETSPSEAQKKAGNYKMGHVKVGAFDVTIENPKGSERSGTDANGKKWSVKMNNTYGYIRGTDGVDGDHIDVFLAEDMDKWDGKYVFVVDQYNPDGTFDEHKVMLGFNSMEEARSAYLSNYEKGWENGRRIDVTAVNLDDFEKWIESSKRKTKPFAEYVVVKKETVGKSGNISDEEIENAAFALGLHGENQTLMRLELDNTPERARQILDRAKKWNEKNAASSTTLSKDETTYTITPSTYTNKKGKTSDVSLLTFDHNLTADQERAVKEFAKERIGEGRFAPVRGWKDRESGGWIFRSEEDARKAAEMVGNEEAVADNQPMTAQELRDAVEPKKPTASKKTAAKKPANRVEVADVAEQKPSEPTKAEQPKLDGEKKLVITDEMKHDEDILRELLGIGDEELDGGIKFRDPDAMTSQQRRFVYNAGVNYSLGYIDQGFVKFPEFAKAMVSRLGYKIKPWLKSFYEGAKRIPGYDQAMFTPTEEVDAFDVENFDKPHKDVVAQANMIVEEGKAQVAAEKANNELKATRNEQRKETEKQTAANTDAIGSKATSVASEVENLAETSSDRQELGGASERVDETLDKVNEQLALLGYYEAEEVEKDYNEAYGYMRNAEKKAVKDAANLASQLIDDLGLDRFEATHGKADKKGKRKTKPLAVANIAPLGGDVSMHLPLEEGRELYVNIQLVPSAGRGVAKFEGDNLEVTRIMFRVDNPNGNGNGRYDRRYGINVWVNKDVTYSELLDKVKREVYRYLPKRTEVSDGKYAAGDKVQYSTDGGRTWTDAVVAHPNDEGGYLIDTGLAPVLWVNAHPDQLRHKPESNTISDTELIKRITEHPLFKELVDNNPDAQAARTLLGERIMTDVRLSLRKDGYVETYKKLLNDKGFSEKIADKAFAKRHIVSKNDEGGYFYEDGINEDAVAALPEGIHIKDDVTRRSENGGVQHTASEKPVGKPKSASQKTTKKVKPEQSVGDLFAGPLDNTSDNGLQGNDDAVRTETVPADNSGQQQGLQESQGSPRKRAEQEGGRPDGGRGGQSTKKDGAVSAGLHGLTEPKNTRNNHSERGADHAPTSVNGRIEANIKAIELAHDLLESGETATPEQMGVLRKFSGWGGLGAAFSDGGNDWKQRERNKKIRELLGEEAYEQAVMSANSAYYTPAYVVDTLWDIANQLGFKGGSILEGSAGIGNILGQMPTAVSERSDIHAIEIDGTSGGILSLLYPDAKVDIQGFEQTRIPNGSVDLAITNVPFVTGLRVNDTTGDSDLSKKFHNIHDFCIAKNVRKLREGGLGIFISSNGTLDNSKALRDWVVNEGGSDFIGAFRMNNKTFGGTTVTSDIIVIRKRVNGQKSAQAIDVSNISGERTADYEEPGARKAKQLSMDYNKYFIEHPDHMAGEMRFAFEEGDTFRPTSKGLYPVSGKDQGKMLADFVKSFTEEERGSAETTESDKPVYVNDASADGKKLGEMYLKDGKLVTAGMGGYYPLEVNDKKIKGHTKQECFNAYAAIKSALVDVMKYQTENEGDAGLQPWIDKLNKAYDAFVSTYGHFTKNNQLAWLRNDVDYPNVFSLEVYKEQGDGKGGVVKTYDKADVMKGRVVEKESDPHPENVKDGVVVSMFKNGRIDVPYIAGQLGMSETEVKHEIIESGLGFEDPATRQMEVSYKYLSGNVREKLKQAEANNENGEYTGNIKALQEVVPMNIPAHLIDFTLGSSWLDPKLYDAYVKERTDIDVHFTAAGGTWFMKAPTYGVNVEKNRAMGIVSKMLKKTIMGHELISAAIQNKSIIVSRTEKHYDGTTETITDREATAACAVKIDEIRQDFKDWARGKMQSDADLSARMEQEYNDRFNNYVPMSIPDDFVPEYFGGATHKFKMRPHQGKAIVRGTMQPLLLAHEVGTGKTFTLISTAMEMRRLGTARKPMIVVQNATVGQFAASAKELYPNAKILTLEDNDRNAEGRKNFYAKIKYNDWDMIVVPQSTFEFIPDSDERQMQFVQDKIDEKMLVLEKMREADTSGRDPITRRAEKELADLQAEMAALSEDISKKRTANNEKKKAVAKQNAAVKAQEMLDRRTDDVENFDDMGIDALLIDEAHEYKHLGFATAMQRGVKGVDPSYSKKSQGVYLKTQAILEKNNGRNVIFATGTPISNTAAEIWTFMRYLMPKDTMKEYGIYYFDDFVRNFGNIQQMPEFNTSGKFKEVNRFAGYVNLPELVRIWSGVADTVLTKDQTELVKKIPEMEGGKAQDIYLPQTRALRSVMKYVREELERFDQMSGKEKKENSSIPLTMYGIAQGAAVDARLVEMNAEDDPKSKTNEAVRQTLRSLKETDEYKGTVAIFADHYQNKQSGFNLYEDIKKKLIKQGVPENEIVVMKSGMKIKQKLEIFEKVNRGEVRVILGSTATLGTGVNIQERLHTLIHLDAPNRPMDYTQRNGRILRQGNLHKQWNKPVRVLRFGVEDSLDVTAYQRLKTKGAIADSVMEGDRLMQDSMNNRVLEEEEDVFGDTVAQLSGSEYALLKNNAEKNVRKYESRRKQWEADQTYIHNAKPKLEGQIKAAEQRAEEANAHLLAVQKAFPNGKFTEITVGKQKFGSIEAMADFIKEHNKKVHDAVKEMKKNPGNAKQTSTFTLSLGGYDFVVKTELSRETVNSGGSLFAEIHRKMSYSCPELGLTDMPVKQSLLRNAVEDITENVITGRDFAEQFDIATRMVQHSKSELEQLKQREGKPFEFSKELEEAKRQFEEYSEAMKVEMAEKEKKYAEMDASVDAATDVVADDEDEADDGNSKHRMLEDDTPNVIENDSNAMVDRVTELSERLHTPVRIIRTEEEVADLPSARQRRMKGSFNPITGEVTIVVPNNANMTDIENTFVHEVVGHDGLRVLFPDEAKLNNALDELYRVSKDEIRGTIDRMAQKMYDAEVDRLRERKRKEYEAKGEDTNTLYHTDIEKAHSEASKKSEQFRRDATEEYAADLAGRIGESGFETMSAEELTFWGKLTTILQKALQKLLDGLKIQGKRKWSDKDWAFVLHEAYKRKKNGGKPTVFDAADTVVMRGKTGFGDTKFSDGKREQQTANERFNNELTRYQNGEMDKNEMLHIGRPQGVMRAFLPNLPIVMRQRILTKGSVRKHNVAVEALVDMPNHLSHPIFVFKRSDNVLGVLTEMQDRDGKNVCVAIELNRQIQNGGEILEVNDIRSVHGRNVADIVYPIVQNGTLKWVDKEKGLTYLSSASQYVQQEIDKQDLNTATKVVKDFVNPKVSDENVADEGVMFRDGDMGLEETITKIKVEAAQAAQKATENLNLGGRVVVHESAEGLEGREATAKGWYDIRTGQIHVVLSNNADAADVTQTILHEAVAHHGLRGLFGHNVMDAFLDSVLATASQEVKDAINELRRGKGWNFRTATEEYLAGLAERTDFERMTAEKRGLFATLRRLFNRALEFLGLKNRELSDRELAYILWCSYQNLKAGEKGRYVAEAERIAMRYKLKAGKNAMTDTEKKEHSVLLRGELDNLQEILAKDTYERLVTRGSHLERTAWVDMLSPLQDLQHAIEKNGGFKLGDFENPYNAYITMSSRNYAQMDIYKRTLYADMIEAIYALGSETGRSYEEIKTYVMAKHGMERQKYMAGKAAEEAYDRYKSMHPFGQKTLDDFIDEYEEKSFAGLTELFGTQSVSDAMDEAQKYVEEVEAEAGSLADSMWDSIRAATKSSLQRAYEAGLISKETYDNVSSMYQYYIPLRGFDETTSDEVYEYFGDQTINGGTGSFMKKAKGRKSVADDPFAVIGNMAEMAIMQSNRNLMKQQLLNLALNHPSDLISVSNLYVKFDEDYDNGDGTRGAWVPVAVPDTSGMTTEEANQVMLDFQDDMEEKVKDEPDTYALAHQKPHIPYRVLGRNMNEHQVMVKRGGKTYILTVNGNPRAAQAINGLLNPDATENPGAIALKAMTNWIARMATARNVEFAISNAMRDLEFSTTLIPKEGTEYYGRYVKNYLTCVKNIGRLVNRLNGNTLDMSNPLEKAFYDFIYNGGETGYTFMKGVERYKGEITKALSELRAKEGKSKTERLGNKIVYGHHYIINDAWNIYMKGAEYLSRCTEDWVRFAVFLTSRQSGRSMEQSIMDAKEVTVNFNRKGAGSKSAGKWDVSNFFSMNNLHFLSAYAASAFKNFYAFSNASIQGLDKNVRLHLNHTAGMLMWDGAAVTLGMLSAMCIPLMLSAIGGDPDDYWDMPESMRRMGIMLPLGKDGRFLTLPMSIEHRAAYGIGELLGTVVCGSENLPASEITFQAFEQLSQILPLDLTEGNGSMLSLVPTAVRPEVEIAFNKNWLGMPIYKEPFNKNTPAFRNVYQSTNPNYIAMSKWLNEVQGGGDYERAGVQVNPAMVQHLVESYTGGAGKFVSRTSGVIAKIIQGEQIRSNEIPFYRTLVKSVDDRTHNRAARERFQREYDKGQKLIYKIDNYQKESARGNSQYVKELDEFAKSKDFMSYMLWKSYNSVKSQFDNARSYIGDDKDKRAALDHAQMLVQKMMTECARAVEDSKTQEEADEKIGRIQSEYTPQIKETLSKVED
jgi:N12 class adenine-specific DNA methylase